MAFSIYRWNRTASRRGGVRDRPERVRADDPRRDQDQERDGPDAHLPPPCREDLRLVLDEHQRPNTLACLCKINEPSAKTAIYPAAHYVLKDLVPDMSNFYEQHKSVRPYRHQGGRRRREPQTKRTARSSTGCTSACSARAARRRAPRTGGTPTVPRPRRAAVVPLARRQPRREAEERLDFLDDAFKVYRCHTIMNCSATCLKHSTREGDRRDQALMSH